MLSSKSYSRVGPTGLFRTVTTKLNLQCGKRGATLHWNEHRSLTVMETKRAQGFLDEDVIIGTPRDQIKIIGNSVDKNVALALGLSLRDSWVSSNRRKRSLLPASEASSHPSANALLPASPVSDSDSKYEDCSSQRPSPARTGIASGQEEREEIREKLLHAVVIVNDIVFH